MLKLTKNAEVYLDEFKLELEKFERVTRKSISIVKNHMTDDYSTNKHMHRIHKEELEEFHMGYWRLVTKLDTVNGLIMITVNEYKSLEKLLNQGLTNFVELLKINDSQTEKNNYLGDVI